jgi:hypothetical protein
VSESGSVLVGADVSAGFLVASRAPGSVPVAVLRVSTSEGVSESGSVLVGADVSAGFLFASHASGGVPVPVPVPVPEAVVYRVSMGE